MELDAVDGILLVLQTHDFSRVIGCDGGDFEALGEGVTLDD